MHLILGITPPYQLAYARSALGFGASVAVNLTALSHFRWRRTVEGDCQRKITLPTKRGLRREQPGSALSQCLTTHAQSHSELHVFQKAPDIPGRLCLVGCYLLSQDQSCAFMLVVYSAECWHIADTRPDAHGPFCNCKFFAVEKWLMIKISALVEPALTKTNQRAMGRVNIPLGIICLILAREILGLTMAPYIRPHWATVRCELMK